MPTPTAPTPSPTMATHHPELTAATDLAAIDARVWLALGNRPPEVGIVGPIPAFSTDIAEAMKLFNHWPTHHRALMWSGGKWAVHLTALIAGQSLGEFQSVINADTPEMAICLAFLKAKEYEARLAAQEPPHA
jgi:hypothetical protein